MNKENKNMLSILSSANILQKKEKDEGGSGEGGFSGPKNDTYARILSDLGGSLNPQMLDDFEQQYQEIPEAQKSDRATSKDFEKQQAKEKDQRSEKEYQPTPEQAFSKGRSGPRR
jgi:hypothetical protein